MGLVYKHWLNEMYATAMEALKTNGALSGFMRKSDTWSVLSVPRDIWLEILSRCLPPDLLILLTTNKFFYELLTGTNSTSVWRSARERSGLYVIPDGLSEEAWAELLWGDVCHICGVECDGRDIYSALVQRRICTCCRHNELVTLDNFDERYPGANSSVLSLLPGIRVSQRRNCTHGWLPEHVERMVASHTALLADVQCTQPGAETLLEEFLTAKSMALEDALKIAVCVQDWLIDLVSLSEKGNCLSRKRPREDGSEGRAEVGEEINPRGYSNENNSLPAIEEMIDQPAEDLIRVPKRRRECSSN